MHLKKEITNSILVAWQEKGVLERYHQPAALFVMRKGVVRNTEGGSSLRPGALNGVRRRLGSEWGNWDTTACAEKRHFFN